MPMVKLASQNYGQRLGAACIERARSSAGLKRWQPTHVSLWYAEVYAGDSYGNGGWCGQKC
jgi:hypothetical protein